MQSDMSAKGQKRTFIAIAYGSSWNSLRNWPSAFLPARSASVTVPKETSDCLTALSAPVFHDNGKVGMAVIDLSGLLQRGQHSRS